MLDARSRQVMRALDGATYAELHLPPPSDEILPGVRWGAFDEIFSPAFWAGRVWLQAGKSLPSYKLGSSLREEVAACILGGYGIPAEVGLAAFGRIRQRGLLGKTPTAAAIERALTPPLRIGERNVRYRFHSQKAKHLADAMRQLGGVDTSLRGRPLRDALLNLSGVGLKTASWIVRNWCDSDDVAILDVHICRACERAGVFEPASNPARNYRELEARYLSFATALQAKPALLDNLLWQTMRRFSRPGRRPLA